MRFSIENDIRIAEIPVEDFRVIYYDGKKKSMGKNRCTGGFFGGYKSDEGEKFTFPAGHLVADFEAESDTARFYCSEWGRFQGDKFILDSSTHEYMNQFYGNSITTLTVANGHAQVSDVFSLPSGCDYAITGVPIMRQGQDVKFATYVKGQGWTGSSLYGTWHVFVGIKERNATTVYVMAMQTKTGNMILSAEAYKKFKILGFYDVIKLDGGGSFYWNVNGKAESTLENRRICTIIDMGELDTSGNPYPAPTRALRKGSKGDDVKWLQWELNAHGFVCAIDGSFGCDTDKQLRAYQKANGLSVDGSCGPATRASLLGK